MKQHRLLSPLPVLIAAGVLALGGCSKKASQQVTAAAPTQNAQQSTAAQSPQWGPAGPPPGQPYGSPSGQPYGPPPNQQYGPPSAPPPGQSYGQPQSQPYGPPSGPPSGQPSGPPPPTLRIPAGTRLRVRLDQDLGSKISQTGDPFSATLANDVMVNETTVIPRGSRAEGTVIDAKPLGRFKGEALLEIRLERVRTPWGGYPVSTSTIERVESGKGRRTAEFIGGGGGLGALIGGLAGGGRGALIGALAGAGAGTAGTAFTGNRQIFLPTETLLTFRLEHSVSVTE